MIQIAIEEKLIKFDKRDATLNVIYIFGKTGILVT